MSVMAIFGVQNTIYVLAELYLVHRGATDADDFVVFWELVTLYEIVERGNQFDLGEVTRNAKNYECEIVHRGSLAER